MPEPKPPRFLFVSMVLFLSVETPIAAEPATERPSSVVRAALPRASHPRPESAGSHDGLPPKGQLLSAQ